MLFVLHGNRNSGVTSTATLPRSPQLSHVHIRLPVVMCMAEHRVLVSCGHLTQLCTNRLETAKLPEN